MDGLLNAVDISASGMKVQSKRMRIVSENIANADATSLTPGGEPPYRRKTISFKSELDRATGANKVEVNKIGVDDSDFPLKYDPSHPGADEAGYVKTTNVKTMVEMMDMRESRRSYEANLSVIENSKAMLEQTIGLLR